VIRSGRKETYAPGKDTGLYWDAGASNVHWVIVTDNQVEAGIKLALGRVESPGVIIEGNSFWKFVEVDFAIMVAREEGGKLKASARRALAREPAIYLSGGGAARERFAEWCEASAERAHIAALPVYTHEELPQLVSRIRARHSAVAV
jgi:hypothetical protein